MKRDAVKPASDAAASGSALPRRLLTLSAFLAVALFAASGWILLRMSRQVPAQYAEALDVRELIGRIDYLDEALTASARLAASAADTAAARRYGRLDREVYAAIDTLGALAGPLGVRADVDAMKRAADRLGGAEKRALALIREGRPTDAAALLTTDSYRRDKQAYQNIKRRILSALQRHQRTHVAVIRRQLRGLALFAGASALLLLLTWWVASGVVRRQAERQRASEEETEAQRRYFEHLFESSPDAIAIVDEHDRVVRVNQEFSRMFGYSAAEMEDRTLADTIAPPELVAEARAAYQRAKLGETVALETTRRTKSGQIKPVTIRATRLEMPDGARRFYGIYEDISERREAQDARRESEERYRSLFLNNPNVVFSLDLRGRLTSLNPAALRLSSYEESELLGRPFLDVVADRHRGRAREVFALAIAGSTQEWEIAIRRKDDSDLVLHGISLPMVVRGELQGVFGMAEDWTERRRLEGQLRHAERLEAVGQLAGGVAHDFNNILTAISGYVQLALEDVPAGSDLAQDLKEASAAAARGATLSRELLAFSRKQDFQPRVFDLNAVLERQRRMIQRVLGANVEVVLELDPALLNVHADPDHIEHALLNLVVNARDAMPVGGRLVITTRNATAPTDTNAAGFADLAPGDYALVTVEDTGIGMDAATLARIFEPFFTTKEKGRGTGLGLSAVFGVVRQAGGDVRADSEPGAGTRFQLALPAVHDKLESAPRERRRSGDHGAGELVLIAEDDPAVRSLVHRTLERNGYDVREASGAAEALAVLEQRADVRLLVTDLVMPAMSGADLAERAHQVRPDLPVLFMSGYADQEILRRGLSRSGAPLLRKPFSPTELLASLALLLHHPHPDSAPTHPNAPTAPPHPTSPDHPQPPASSL